MKETKINNEKYIYSFLKFRNKNVLIFKTKTNSNLTLQLIN